MEKQIAFFVIVLALFCGCSINDTIADKITGLEEPFSILRPSEKALGMVRSSEFGMSPSIEDNTDAFCKAILYLKDNPGTKLKIDEGTYYFKESGMIRIDSLRKCMIDGSDAKFIFCQKGTFFQITDCDILEIKGLTIDIDRVNNPLEDIVEVRNASREDHTLEFVFFNREEVRDSMFISAISVCDPDGYTYGMAYPACNKEVYTYQNPNNVSIIGQLEPNVLKISYRDGLELFENGDKLILRYYVYDGQVFNIGKSSNLTFNGLRIYGGYGCGFVVGDLTNHYQIIGTTIGVDPGDTTGAQCSIGADGIHVAGSGGYFRLEGCDISRQGDDAVNIHDGIGYIYQVDSNRIGIFSSQTRLKEGEILAFKDSTFRDLSLEAAIISVASLNVGPGSKKEVVLDRDISSLVKPGYIIYSKTTDSGHYVIRNNYFHENRARGLLLQSSNGLCENNTFYKTQGQAIKIVMDILPMYWQEGTGVTNLTIRNNTFDKCDFSGWGEQITINTNIDGHRAAGTVFKDIHILGNSFTGVCRKVIDAMNVDGLVFTGNSIATTDACDEEPVNLRDYCTHCTMQ